MKKVLLPLIVLSILVVGGLAVAFVVSKGNKADYGGPITIADCVFRLEEEDGECVDLVIASEPEERVRGLSGVQHLPEDQGMIFDFQTSGTYCMWMKDMHFSLDMIWLDAGKRIVEIKKDIAPGTYPNTFCNEAAAARYVIEVRAGVAEAAGLQEGRRLDM